MWENIEKKIDGDTYYLREILDDDELSLYPYVIPFVDHPNIKESDPPNPAFWYWVPSKRKKKR